MKRKTVVWAAAGVTAVLLMPPGAKALLGFGMPVIDVTAIVQLIKQVGQMEQQYQELIETYKVISNRYQLAVQMAEHFSAKSLWQGLRASVAPNLTFNTYGETADWQTAVTTGNRAWQAWQEATFPLKPDATLTSQIPGQSESLALLASVEIADGANRASTEALGNSRFQQGAMNEAIQQLEGTVLDGSDDTNTEIQQLNLMNAGIVQSLRMEQDSNAVMTSTLEESMATNKIYRDAAATLFNAYAIGNAYKGEGQWGAAGQSSRLP